MGGGKGADFFHAEAMMGMQARSSGAVLAVSLEKSTAEKLKDRTAIEKELRKSKPGKKGGLGALVLLPWCRGPSLWVSPAVAHLHVIIYGGALTTVFEILFRYPFCPAARLVMSPL